MVYTYNRILNKKSIVPFAMTQTNLEDIILIDISQMQKENATCFHSHVESKIDA